jgi:hypothetical protein
MRLENASSFEDEAEGFGKSLFLNLSNLKDEKTAGLRSNVSAFFDLIITVSLAIARK